MEQFKSWLFDLPFTGWLEGIYRFFADNPEYIAIISLGSLAIFFISLLSLPWLVSLIPEDYFNTHKRMRTDIGGKLSWLRPLLLALKNILGAILIIGGIAMLFLPGQGLLTIAMGLFLCDYPGKFKLERRIVSRPAVLNGLNWFREKANKPPLVISEPED